MFLINFNQWKCACVGINNLAKTWIKVLFLLFLNKLKYLNWSVFDVDNIYIWLHIFWKAGCSNKYFMSWNGEIKENIKGGLQRFHPNHSNSQQRSFCFKPAQLATSNSILCCRATKQTGTAERWAALVQSASRLADQRTLNAAYCTPRKITKLTDAKAYLSCFYINITPSFLCWVYFVVENNFKAETLAVEW